ncbi:MAG: class I SAM-dependent methyltransferase [Nanoarchaeota archaeon]
MTGHAAEGGFSDLCMTHINKTAILLEFLKNEKNGLVLNVGCGSGMQTKKMLEKGFYVISVDFDINLLKEAQKITNNIVLADAVHLPFKESKFDYVTCMDVLEHLDKDDDCIEEIYYVIKSSGKFILSVPMLNYPFVYDPINKIRSWASLKPIPIGLWAWEHKRLYKDEQIAEKIKFRFNIIERKKLSSFFVALFENYLPYMFSYKIKLKRSGNPPRIFKKFTNFICKVDEKYFLENMGYINLALKARPI